jgi:hypothetical protein
VERWWRREGGEFILLAKCLFTPVFAETLATIFGGLRAAKVVGHILWISVT